MLVFFIHGVATRNSDYAEDLRKLIRQETSKNNTVPHFFSGFWGSVINKSGQMWNNIYQDVTMLKSCSPPNSDVKDIFRYQEFREDFITKFFGDFLTYLNLEQGRKIRQLVTQQLIDYLQQHPNEKELHIVSHSLGTLILWHLLFSEELPSDDPSYELRQLVHVPGFGQYNNQPVTLASITTMGSPLLFFTMMFNVNLKFKESKKAPLRWLNLLHSSDVIAYPLRSTLNYPHIRDKYIWTDANFMEKGARAFGQTPAAMAVGITDAHAYYWKSPGSARLIAANILGDLTVLDAEMVQPQ